MPNPETTVKEVEIENIESLFSADNVIVPEKKDNAVKPSIFSKEKNVDLSFIETEEPDETKVLETEIKEILTPEQILAETEEASPEDKSGGRPKVSKDGMVELANKLIEKGVIIPFEDDKPLDKYTIQDFEELLEENFKERERKLKEDVPVEFFDSLPEELQYAAKYVADGGKDLKGLFRQLAAVEEIRSLDPKNENDQEEIIRSYLLATNFGDDDEIEDEINAWKDRNELEQKALKFKPKLDALQENIVSRKLKEQEDRKAQQMEQAKKYTETVYKVLEPGELNGIKLDKKTQSMLYAGLVQPNYPSVSGRQTNLLGHLLEKYQFVEPNPALIAEALWLLNDPTGYKEKVREITKKEEVEKTVRMLKTEQSNRAKTSPEDEQDDTSRSTRKGIPRASSNFFKR